MFPILYKRPGSRKDGYYLLITNLADLDLKPESTRLHAAFPACTTVRKARRCEGKVREGLGGKGSGADQE